MQKRPSPPGANPLRKSDRLPVFKVIGGDTWTFDFSLFNPVTLNPATPDNTLVRMIITENRFSDDIIWSGSWGSGIFRDMRVPGLTHVVVPHEVTERLRRGVYSYSILITALENEFCRTEKTGSLQVEYEATSPTHDIPYRSGDTIFNESDPIATKLVEQETARATSEEEKIKNKIARGLPLADGSVTEEKLSAVLNINLMKKTDLNGISVNEVTEDSTQHEIALALQKLIRLLKGVSPNA